MRHQTPTRIALATAGLGLLAFSLACGGSSTGTSTSPAPQGTVNLTLSDASTEDWATIGVKVLGITLTPQGGGTPVTVYTAPATAPMINLCQLDQLSELLGNMSVPEGTYTKATLTLAANPGDVTLVTASSPSAGFPVAGGTTIDPANIQIKNATGTAPNLTTSVSVHLVTPLVVTAGQSNALDLEFDLSHPALLVDHTSLGGTTTWAVSFNGPVRHHPHYDLTRILLREMKGQVTAVAADNSAITLTKEYEAYPVPASGPAPISSLQSITVKADATNGTIFYDLDAHTTTVIKDFSSVAGSLVGKQIRLTARYQADGSLTAVRVWASSSWAKIWVSPEGHVNHVDATNNLIYLDNQDGKSIPVAVDANTVFFFRTPAKALADATPIGTGPAFLANLVRGFKVHIGVVDPLAANLTARTVDIEIARFDGKISGATTSQFTYTRAFLNTPDDYTVTLPYISAATPNGKDASGNAILGFKWWNFTFPTLVDTGANAIPDFVAAVGGAANFGGTVGAVNAWGMSYAAWADPANPTGWSAQWSVLEPTRLPKGTVATPWATTTGGGTFGMSVVGGLNTVPVTLSTVSGSATLVYDVSMTGTTVTVNPVDVTTAAGQAALATYLVNGTTVKVYGIPQPDGSIKAYAVTYIH
jgi:hypothetical protein